MSDHLCEAYVIADARHDRGAAENFIGGDPHKGPMPLNYYVWVLRNAHLRGRMITHSAREGLEALGVDPETIENVVITHMHYDHAGNDGLFLRARFHIQDSEMGFATGQCMCHPGMSHLYELDDAVVWVLRVCAGRVCFDDGDTGLFPGITLHHIGGHAGGRQALGVQTQHGPVVVASDAAHRYAHICDGPFLQRRADVRQRGRSHGRAHGGRCRRATNARSNKCQIRPQLRFHLHMPGG